MNINEIAKLAGVSRAAVSRYLNHGYLSEEKKESIRKVIEETGYKPSSQAQMLRTKKTRMIGVILPKINSQSISSMVAGISEVVNEEGYQLLLANTNNNIDEEINYIRVFRENHVEGIIFIATVLTKKHREVMAECEMPIVVLGQDMQGYSCVYQDDKNAAADIAKELLRGAKKPAFIGVFDKDEAVGLNRKKGFLLAAEESGVQKEDIPMKTADFTIDSGYQVMKELLEEHPKIDAVLCVTEGIAIGAATYIKEIGKRIPEDIALAGMGESIFGRIFSPKISTIRFHYITSGEEAAKMLMDEINNEKIVKKRLCMSYELSKGESTR